MQSGEQGEGDDQTDDRFPVSLRGSWFGLNRKFRLRLSDHPLTPAQYTTLRNICEFQNGVLNQKKLSELVSSNENNLVAILRKLERCKLIERQKKSNPTLEVRPLWQPNWARNTFIPLEKLPTSCRMK